MQIGILRCNVEIRSQGVNIATNSPMCYHCTFRLTSGARCVYHIRKILGCNLCILHYRKFSSTGEVHPFILHTDNMYMRGGEVITKMMLSKQQLYLCILYYEGHALTLISCI